MQSQRIRQQPAETYDSLLGPNQSLEKVTATVSDIVLTPLKKTPFGWPLGFVLAACFLGCLLYTSRCV